MDIKERIYNHTPVFFQNFMVSVYGLQLYYQRYWGNHKKYLERLLESQWWSKDKIRSYQTKKFTELIKSAYENVPYYRKIFDKYGFYSHDFRCIDDVKRLPILKKETIRTQSHLLISQDFDKRRLVPISTSGTTGKSLKVCIDLDSRRKQYAFMSRFQRWAGLRNGRHNITFSGKNVVPEGQGGNFFWRYNGIMDSYHFSSYHLSDRNIPYYIEKMRSFNPKFIDAYPSSIYTIAKYMEERSVEGIFPVAILTTAETLPDYQRKTIERVFSCPVYDQYGCAEQALFVSQCEKGSYHIHPEYGIVEVINDDGKEAEIGESGRIVCTSFLNNAMPLIRYEVGDIVSKDDFECKCGRNFPVLRRVEGRKDDLICTPDGRRVSRVTSCFRGVTSVKLAQIVQNRIDNVEVRLVPGETYVADDGELIKSELQKRLGELVHIQIKLVDNIPKSRSGKFKSVVSDIS